MSHERFHEKAHNTWGVNHWDSITKSNGVAGRSTKVADRDQKEAPSSSKFRTMDVLANDFNYLNINARDQKLSTFVESVMFTHPIQTTQMRNDQFNFCSPNSTMQSIRSTTPNSTVPSMGSDSIDNDSTRHIPLVLRTIFDISTTVSGFAGSQRGNHLIMQRENRLARNEISFSVGHDCESDFYCVAIGGSNKVSLYDDEDGKKFDDIELISETLYGEPMKPTAVTIVVPGLHYAVLSFDEEIISCSYIRDAWAYKLILKRGFNGLRRLRGLTADQIRETIFTFDTFKKRVLCINVKNSACNEILFTCDYGAPSFTVPSINAKLVFGNVSFMDFNNGILALSDLGARKDARAVNQCLISTYKVDYNANRFCEHKRFFNEQAFLDRTPGFIRYGSGIIIDSEGWVLVGDAPKGVCHLFNECLEPICIIQTFGGQKPYIAGIAISQKGMAMASPHKAGADIIIYKFGKAPNLRERLDDSEEHRMRGSRFTQRNF